MNTKKLRVIKECNIETSDCGEFCGNGCDGYDFEDGDSCAGCELGNHNKKHIRTEFCKQHEVKADSGIQKKYGDFETLQGKCDKYKCKYWCDARGCFCDTVDNCPENAGEYKQKSVFESILTEEQQEDFNCAAEPFMRFLEKHCHPHTKVIIDSSRAELFEALFIAKTGKSNTKADCSECIHYYEKNIPEGRCNETNEMPEDYIATNCEYFKRTIMETGEAK